MSRPECFRLERQFAGRGLFPPQGVHAFARRTQQRQRVRAANRRPGEEEFALFGNEHAARNFSVLYSLVQTAERQGVNSLAYLEDVLMRVQTHPDARIDDAASRPVETARPIRLTHPDPRSATPHVGRLRRDGRALAGGSDLALVRAAAFRARATSDYSVAAIQPLRLPLTGTLTCGTCSP